MGSERRLARKELVTILRELRRGAGLRQSDLAARLGRPQSYVSKYESGQRKLDIVELREICTAIGTTLEELVAKFDRGLS